ncbi:MAG TPA: DUF1156 domain-containing protein [Candidatus Lokiarchaeia archaeon]|nr:DUF1156 domain-containing protein [Candidatus Lokiarchaeia archaeon]
MVPPNRVLIESYFPVEQLSRYGRKEKKGRPKTFEMHYWWTRKPIVVARAALFGALLPENFDPAEFERILGFGNQVAPYKRLISESDGKTLRESASDIYGHSVKILDPFAGGGSLPYGGLEAGLDVAVNDYNPVSWLIMKTSLEYPVEFGSQLREDVEKWGNHIITHLQSDLGAYYPPHDQKPALAYIYAWMVDCPSCGMKVPLVNSWNLANFADDARSVSIEPVFREGTWEFLVKRGSPSQGGTCTRASGTCLSPSCGATIPNASILAQLQSGAQEQVLAVVTNGKTRKEYSSPTQGDLEGIARSSRDLDSEYEVLIAQNLIPTEEMPLHTIRPAKYLTYWKNLFNPRQLLFFAYFTRIIRDVTSALVAEHGLEYGRAIGAYLTLFLGKLLDYNCRLTAWIAQREGVLHACSNKLNAIQWDHAEINPFSGGSGSMASALKGILQGFDYSLSHLKSPPTQVTNASIYSMPGGKYDVIITDPPYFDDAPYGELSEFFHVWESRAVGEYFADINPVFASPVTPKDEDISVSFQRRGTGFSEALRGACARVSDMLAENGIVVLFFAHSGLPAWEAVINALHKSRLTISTTWPVHTENVGISNWSKDAIYTSLIIIARKRTNDTSVRAEDLEMEVEACLENCLKDFWTSGFRGADLVVAAIGATLRVVTQYATIQDKLESMAFDVKPMLELVKTRVAEFVALQ